MSHNITSLHNDLHTSNDNEINDRSYYQKTDNLRAQRTVKSIYTQLVHEEKDKEFETVRAIDRGNENKDYLQIIDQDNADKDYQQIIEQDDEYRSYQHLFGNGSNDLQATSMEPTKHQERGVIILYICLLDVNNSI